MSDPVVREKAKEQSLLMKDLLEATTENIKSSTKHNKKLGKYTFWMMVMTAIITICTIVQVFVAMGNP